ncbi:MAG: hypothetical protein HYR56_17820 [Acidobacteria bacterium]|nr:hypothetical protein [Acidobacteriota bacterium]MBI3424051.1 hypothetical protein [Acidobacteriota bacterium]
MPWLPHEKYIWDSWFAWQGEELHAFYLQADQAACGYNPDARHNLAEVGHAVLSRWGWQELNGAPALKPAPNAAWDDLAIWTGSIVQPAANAPYFMFYTARRRADAPLWTPSEWQRPQHIGLAISRDLRVWERIGTTPVIPNFGKPLGLDGVAWRDPYVVRGDDGAWYAFICARLNPLDANNKHFGLDAGGAIVWLRSETLDNWRVEETRQLVASDEFYQMEVPQVFWRAGAGGKRFYLLFCAQEKDCSRARRQRGLACATGTYYMHSELLPLDYQGVPKLPEPARLLAAGLYAGKLLRPETAARPVLLGFPWADAAGHFTGGISDAQFVTFAADGALEVTHG